MTHNNKTCSYKADPHATTKTFAWNIPTIADFPETLAALLFNSITSTRMNRWVGGKDGTPRGRKGSRPAQPHRSLSLFCHHQRSKVPCLARRRRGGQSTTAQHTAHTRVIEMVRDRDKRCIRLHAKSSLRARSRLDMRAADGTGACAGRLSTYSYSLRRDH